MAVPHVGAVPLGLCRLFLQIEHSGARIAICGTVALVTLGINPTLCAHMCARVRACICVVLYLRGTRDTSSTAPAFYAVVALFRMA